MSEIVDIPDDSSPSEDSCLMEVGLRSHRNTGEAGDGGDGGEYINLGGPASQTPESPLAGGPRARRFIRGERSNSCSSPSTATTTYRWVRTHGARLELEVKTVTTHSYIFCPSPVFPPRSPVLRRQAMLASSCSQLEAVGSCTSKHHTSIPEILIHPSTPSVLGAIPASSAPLTSSSSIASEQCSGQLLPRQPLYLRRRAGKSERDGENVRKDREGFLRLVRSHSEPGLGSSTETGKSDTNITPTYNYFHSSHNLSKPYISLVDFGSGSSKASIDTGKSSLPWNVQNVPSLKSCTSSPLSSVLSFLLEIV